MNRQTKRMMRPGSRPVAPPRPQPERRRRVGPRQFLREVRQELKKVAWPTRRELFTYTMVVLVTVVIVTSIVFGLDQLFSRAVFAIFGGQS